MSTELWLDLRREMRILVEYAANGIDETDGNKYPHEQFEKVLDAVEAIAISSLYKGGHEQAYKDGYEDASRGRVSKP